MKYTLSEQTKKRMSEAKMGRKYNNTHKLNMALTHIIKHAERGGWCPVQRIIFGRRNHKMYEHHEKMFLLQSILKRGIKLPEESLDLLNETLLNDK